MNNHVRAFAPGNISLIFQVLAHTDPQKMGSKGVGFTILEGATVSVRHATKQIRYNQKVVVIPTVNEVLDTLTSKPISVDISSPLPLGSGFGMSAASALACSYAVNALCDLKKTNLELAKIAHRAEVVHKTGLGDVANEYFGGFFIKKVSSSKFEVIELPIAEIPIYCLSYGKLLTSSILSDDHKIQHINKEAEIALTKIKTTSSIAHIFDIANTFTRNAKLQTPEVARLIADIEKKGGHAAQILVGNAVVSDIPFAGCIQYMMGTRKATLL